MVLPSASSRSDGRSNLTIFPIRNRIGDDAQAIAHGVVARFPAEFATGAAAVQREVVAQAFHPACAGVESEQPRAESDQQLCRPKRYRHKAAVQLALQVAE